MSTIIFKLNNVPDDEADEVRELLTHHHIDFYETSAGRWGISLAAIWVKDDNLKQKARALIDNYQAGKILAVREEYASMQKEGQAETFISRIWQHPVQFIAILALILFILYISISPFVGLGG